MADKHSTYKIGYQAGHVKHHEWRTAENSAQYVIPRLQSQVQQNPHLKMLDVGAGPGTISTSFAKYMPEGEIIATDLSEEIVSRAAAFAESKGVMNISFQLANVYELPFDDESFDVVHAHQVLCHLDSPVDALKEMIRVTKKGGFMALRESDMQMWCIWPNMQPLLQFQQASIGVLKENGGQDMGGRMLVNWILQADVEREDIEASCGTWCFAQKEDKDTWSELCYNLGNYCLLTLSQARLSLKGQKLVRCDPRQ